MLQFHNKENNFCNVTVRSQQAYLYNISLIIIVEGAYLPSFTVSQISKSGPDFPDLAETLWKCCKMCPNRPIPNCRLSNVNMKTRQDGKFKILTF